MSGFGKITGGRTSESIDALEKEFQRSTDKIRSLLNGRKDVHELQREEKLALSTEYLRASQIAHKLSERLTDPDEVEKYRNFEKRLGDRARVLGSSIKSKVPDTTFDDVKGLENVKKIVKSFVFIAQNPDIIKYYKIEGGLGLLMYGAPGTGKTMFAEAIANALRLPLFVITPADIFKSYVGESEQAVRQLFEEIDACPDGAILFVDECESIFSRRTQDTKDYKAAVTTELLQRINGFGVDGSKRMIVAATNRPDFIDPAYLRYKRFSHLVHVTPPDLAAKRAIIESKLNGIKLLDVTAEDVVQMTVHKEIYESSVGPVEIEDAFYSAADVCGIIEEACRLALEQMQEANLHSPIPLTRSMFEKAFQKIRPSISAELLKQYEDFR